MKPKFRRVLKWAGFVLLLLLLVPPLQVIGVKFWNPSFIPMHAQRHWEARRAGQALIDRPSRWLPLAEIPVAQIHYIWASEDQSFFRHHGFDLPQLGSAIEHAGTNGQPVRGASTISMQCARTIFLWQGRSYLRKALECYYTFWMELFLSKQRILELYLNNIEFGPGIYGLDAAAEFYFHRTPRDLTTNEMIALAAILPDPLGWSPINPSHLVQEKMARVVRLAARAPFPVEELKKK